MKYALVTALFLAGCATAPDRIAPSVASGCSPSDGARLVELTAEQSRAARNDAIGVFWIGLPVSSMAGHDHEAEIARLKACLQ